MRHSFMLDNFLSIDLVDFRIQFCMFFTPAASLSNVCDSVQVTSSICSMPVPLPFIWGKKTWQVVQSQNLSVPCKVIVQQILNPEAQILGCNMQHRERWVPEPSSLLHGNVFPCYQLVWVVKGLEKEHELVNIVLIIYCSGKSNASM